VESATTWCRDMEESQERERCLSFLLESIFGVWKCGPDIFTRDEMTTEPSDKESLRPEKSPNLTERYYVWANVCVVVKSLCHMERRATWFCCKIGFKNVCSNQATHSQMLLLVNTRIIYNMYSSPEPPSSSSYYCTLRNSFPLSVSSSLTTTNRVMVPLVVCHVVVVC